MKIVLFGKGGQLGWELQRSLAPLGEIVALDHDSVDYCGNFSDLSGLADTLRAIKPGLIVNAAAHTAVDQAESEPALVHALNAQAPGLLAQEAARLGSWLVHYSTDYVFDGSGEQAWTEDDSPAPLNVYGHSKLQGEQLIQASGARHLIFRTSWVYATRGGNFAKTMLRLAQERDCLNVIDDQIGAPTGAELLADVTAHALRQVWQRSADGGLYHLCAAGETSWFGYAQYVLAQAKLLRPDLPIKAAQLLPVPSSAFNAAARRPHNSRLDTRRLRTTFGLTLPPWQSGVMRMLSETLSQEKS